MSRLGSVLSCLAHYSSCRGIRIGGSKISLRLSHGRSLALTPQSWEKSKPEDDISRPIKFSTSKASHRTWTVDMSLGSTYQRPLWKVLPISILGLAFILWCALRGETDVDRQLDKELNEHIPGLLWKEEDGEETQEEPVQEESS